MSTPENEVGGNGSGGAERQFTVQSLYVKDLSFEVPNAPEIYAEMPSEPDVNMNLKNGHKFLGNDAHEVNLHISVHAKVNDRSMFLVEIDQAGIFLIKGYSDTELRRLISTYCPATLFPYAREVISSAVAKGGFPSLLLQPINFDALYAQSANRSTAN